jgi:hypothetical protein
MADLENGLYAGWEYGQDKSISTNRPLKFDFVTAVLLGYTGAVATGPVISRATAAYLQAVIVAAKYQSP